MFIYVKIDSDWLSLCEESWPTNSFSAAVSTTNKASSPPTDKNTDLALVAKHGEDAAARTSS